ncbi:hypothetical protein [Terrabacter sp. RAF57]|uniref:hypothetical protein n=1 Tax=Terrabacter sp. RAF57 TaxID=3233063 RepID=UPI003F950305
MTGAADDRTCAPTVARTADVADEPTDIMGLTPAEFLIWCDGYEAGLRHGIERGRGLADDDAARRHHRAFTLVQTMARIPERDAAADRAVAARREARWST